MEFRNMVNVLIKYLQAELQKWRMKTPRQKWQSIYNLGGKLSDSIGVTVFTSMKVHWYCYFSDVMSFIYFSMASYTVWFYFERREYLRGLQATCLIGLEFSCLAMQVLTLRPERFRINTAMNFAGKYIYLDEDRTPKHEVMQEEAVATLVWNISARIILIFTIFTLFGITGVYMIVFEHSQTSIFGLESPFFGEDSDIGFLVNILFQIVLSALGFTACVAIEIGTYLIIDAVSAIPGSLNVESEDLGVEVRLNGMTLDAKARLRNIFMKIQDFERFVREVIDLLYVRLFIGPFLFAYSIAFSIFGQLFLGYRNGYIVAALNYLLLLICCYSGETVEQAKYQIGNELYNMSWYALPVSSQKQVCIAIHMIQNGGSLTIGPFAKLKMETTTDLTKAIYKFTMCIYRTFN